MFSLQIWLQLLNFFFLFLFEFLIVLFRFQEFLFQTLNLIFQFFVCSFIYFQCFNSVLLPLVFHSLQKRVLPLQLLYQLVDFLFHWSVLVSKFSISIFELSQCILFSLLLQDISFGFLPNFRLVSLSGLQQLLQHFFPILQISNNFLLPLKFFLHSVILRLFDCWFSSIIALIIVNIFLLQWIELLLPPC